MSNRRILYVTVLGKLKNMKILVTMAGRGTRFKDVGVTFPKHEILVKGEPMFDWAMRSLATFYDQEFIFVTYAAHGASEFLAEACERLGIGNYSEVELVEYTNGQAQTALAADDHLNADDSIVIYNIDTYIKEGLLNPDDISGDGFIPSFTAPGERWSFIRMDDSGYVTEVSEKEKISDTATAGFYYFDQWSDFVEAYKHSADQVESAYGETYVAPLYNYLIDRGKTVLPHKLDRNTVHVLGTPDDLQQFDPKFTPE